MVNVPPVPEFPGQLFTPNPQYLYQPVDHISTQARVVFIASCKVGPVFLSLWDINESTLKRALVVPDPVAMAEANKGTSFGLDDIDLVQGTIAWETIAKELAEGVKLQKAVTDANTAVAQFYATIPVASRDSALAIWKTLGDANVCLTTCKK